MNTFSKGSHEAPRADREVTKPLETNEAKETPESASSREAQELLAETKQSLAELSGELKKVMEFKGVSGNRDIQWFTPEELDEVADLQIRISEIKVDSARTEKKLNPEEPNGDGLTERQQELLSEIQILENASIGTESFLKEMQDYDNMGYASRYKGGEDRFKNMLGYLSMKVDDNRDERSQLLAELGRIRDEREKVLKQTRKDDKHEGF